MQQYSGTRDGKPTDWHVTHLTKLAIGGAGLVFTEALAVEERGLLTYSDRARHTAPGASPPPPDRSLPSELTPQERG